MTRRPPAAEGRPVPAAPRGARGSRSPPGSTDVRAALQLRVLGGVPPLVILALTSLNVIKVSTALALGLAAALLAMDLLAWRIVAAMFDRERLVTSTRG
jgi:hypothetical protein